MQRYFPIPVFAVAILVVWLIPSCKETPREKYERRLRETEGPSQHAVHSERLLEVMAQLKHLTYSRLPQELEHALTTKQRLEEVQWIAAGMSSAAEFIPEILTDVEMSPEGKQEFRRISSEFQQQCTVLEEKAMSLSVDGLVDEFAAIIDTCDRCHRRFRVLPMVRNG